MTAFATILSLEAKNESRSGKMPGELRHHPEGFGDRSVDAVESLRILEYKHVRVDGQCVTSLHLHRNWGFTPAVLASGWGADIRHTLTTSHWTSLRG